MLQHSMSFLKLSNSDVDALGDISYVLGVCDGQGGLECCDSWGRKESDTTE